MKGDFSKNGFDRRNHYSSVRLQQGRVVTDADWNEQADLTQYRHERLARDVIGACGAPEHAAGFALTAGTFTLAAAALGNAAWFVGEDGTILRTLDGGSSWTMLDAGTTAHLRAVHFATAAIGWIAGDGGALRRTEDAGATWVARDAGVKTALLGIAASGAADAWVVGDGGIVARTGDGGVTWTRQTVGSGRLHAVRFVSATAGWIAGQDGRIFATSDGGSTWTERPSGSASHLRALAFVDANTGWAVGDGGTILRTTNGGLAWAAQASGTTLALRAVAARSATEAWAAGDDGTILRTMDGGSTWQAVDAGQEPVAFHAAAAGAAPHGWIAGDASALVSLGSGSPSPSAEQLPGLGLSIGPGRFYVKGVLCEAEARASFHNQPDRTVAARLDPGQHLVYLDVWQRHVSHLEDPRIREVALGGPDTATRGRTVWQLRTLPLSGASPPEWSCASDIPGWRELTAKPAARLRARAEPEQASASLCELGEAGGFRRVENQLYRVEVHDGGASPTFKWSRENGAVAFPIAEVSESGGQTTITLANRGPDDNLDLVLNGWVEVLDDDAVLENGVGLLRQYVAAGNDPLEIVLDGTVGETGSRPSRHPLIRRWEHRPTAPAAALPIVEGQWIALEDGVEVWFEPGGSYRPGDYWQIPARTALADVEWPRDEYGASLAKPPDGIEHRYCRVAILDVGADGAIQLLSDCRSLFPPLTALTQLLHVSGDGQDGIPGLELPHPLRARVVRGERPVAGATVLFDVVDGAGHLAGGAPGVPIEVTTAADGIAECGWVLDPDIGPGARHQRVAASLVDDGGTPVAGQSIEFCATGSLALEYVSGDGQVGQAGQPLAHPLEVRVANGQTPAQGVPVRFTVVSGGGAIVGAAAVNTGPDGIASVSWQLGPGGDQRVEAELLAGASRVQHIGFNAAFAQQDGGGRRGCDITVGPEGDIKALTTDSLRELLETLGRVCLCLLPGEHVVEDLTVESRGFLTIRGCGPGTTISLAGRADFTGLEYFELAGVTLRPRSPAGFRFEKCSRVVLRHVEARGLADYTGLLLHLGTVLDVQLEGCTFGDDPDRPTRQWLAVVVDDPRGMKRFIANAFQAPVSFYGPPRLPLPLAVEQLFDRLAGASELPARGGSVFLEHNAFGLLTIGAEMVERLNQFATSPAAPPSEIFESALLTGNIIRDNESVFFAKLVALSGTSLVVRPAEPLALFIADTASVASTVSPVQDDLQLFVFTRRQRCREAANVVVIRHV